MQRAKNGDTVKVHYTGKLSDGTVFDSSTDQAPLEFEVGAGKLISGFEKGVVGMASGDTKSLFIPCNEAYGDRDDQLVWEVEKNNLPDEVEPEVGQRLRGQFADGVTVDVVVSSVSPSTVTLDANHPLAGKDLVFDVELVEISS